MGDLEAKKLLEQVGMELEDLAKAFGEHGLFYHGWGPHTSFRRYSRYPRARS